jgi:3'(2'), 5'-bisphosphate nucleotidase
LNIFKKKNWKRDVVQEIISLGNDLLKLRKNNGFTQGEWSGTQFKSTADKYAHSIIFEFLQSIAPSIPIVSEEDECSYGFLNERLYWLVDPIDGTRSYCENYNGFVVQLCLMENSSPIWSCIHAPAEATTYVAERGAGAWINGMQATRKSPKGRQLLIDNYPNPRGICKKVYDLIPSAEYLESGSLGLKICKVGSGQADIFVKNVELKIWDIAPAELFLTELGGSIVDFYGRSLSYIDSIKLTDGLIAVGSPIEIETVLTAVKTIINQGKTKL